MHTAFDRLMAVVRRLRVRRVDFALRWRARWHRAELVCSIADDVRIGRRLRISVQAGTQNVVRIERGSQLWDDVRIELRGGSLLIGSGAVVKSRCVLGVGGILELRGTNLLQHGCIIHCDEAVTLEEYAVLAEYTTVIDSRHVLGGPDGEWLHRIETSPVVIGPNAWIGAKATVARGVHVGKDAVVSANSLVIKDVPPGHLVSGVPAEVIRPLGETSAPDRPAGVTDSTVSASSS
jgi:acetyltransferase-like isoleucine patch superfamily enzyme